MNEKRVKVEIDFTEALRRIAQTPKGSITKKRVVNPKEVVYNDEEAAKKPPPAVKKTT